MNALLDDNEEKELLSGVSVRDPTGRIAVTIGLMATVYFENPWSQEARDAVTDLAHRYLEQFSAELRWARHPKTARMHPIASRHILLPRDWLPQHDDPETSWEFQFHGGSGYGGIGILESPGIVARRDYQAVVRAMAERFPGLEVEARHVSAHHLNGGIKGVNWLTVLSDRWVNAIGGLDYLRARLDDSLFRFYAYDGGLIIQAGPKPSIRAERGREVPAGAEVVGYRPRACRARAGRRWAQPPPAPVVRGQGWKRRS